MQHSTKFIAISTAVLFAGSAKAQAQFGIKFGGNYVIASQTIEPAPTQAPSTPTGLGMHFGGFAQFAFSDQIGLRPELLFSFRKVATDDSQVENNVQLTDQQTGQIGTGTVTTTQKSDTRLSYMEIPAPLVFTPSENFRIMFCPAFGLLLGAKNTSDVTQKITGTIGQTNIDQTSFNITVTKGSASSKYYTGFEVAAIAGAGCTLDMGLDFDLRFYRAIVTTFDRNESTGRSRAWTNMIELSVGYAFGG